MIHTSHVLVCKIIRPLCGLMILSGGVIIRKSLSLAALATGL